MSKSLSFWGLYAALFGALFFTGCGGNGGSAPSGSQGGETGGGTTGGGTTGGTTGGGSGGGGSSVSVFVTPTTNTTYVNGGKIQYTAIVYGAKSNKTVTWSVEGDDHGTIDQDGLYTSGPVTGLFTIVATSNEDSTKRGTAGAEVKDRASLIYFGSSNGGGGLPQSLIYDLSDDGRTVVGQLGDQPAYWTENNGWQTLSLPSGQTTGYVIATADIARHMVGITDGSRGKIPTYWTTFGEVRDLSNGSSEFSDFVPVDISNNGRVIVGQKLGVPYRWRHELGFEKLSAYFSWIYCVSGDGKVIGGKYSTYARVWDDIFGTRNPAPGLGTEVRDLSFTGDVVAGHASFGRQFYEVNKYAVTSPVTHFDMSGNGTWTMSRSGFWADRWSNTTKFQKVNELLADSGYVDSLPYDLFWQSGFIADDGKRIVGVTTQLGGSSLRYMYIVLP